LKEVGAEVADANPQAHPTFHGDFDSHFML